MKPHPFPTLLRMAVRWTTILTVASAVISGLTWGADFALGIALGALLGLVNLALLGTALAKLLPDAGRHRPAPGSRFALPGILLVKWPLLLLALAGILWYLPARPEGLAFGFLLSLVGAAIAALRIQKRSGHASEASDPDS